MLCYPAKADSNLVFVSRVATLRKNGGEQANIEVGVVPYVAYGPRLAGSVISIASPDSEI